MSQTSAPMALQVPEVFEYLTSGPAGSGWIHYRLHPGLYRIRFTTHAGDLLAGNTMVEAALYAATHGLNPPYYAQAQLRATKLATYPETPAGAVSGEREEHDEPATITWRPHAYQIVVGATAFPEWVDQGASIVFRAEIVELRPCTTCGAEAGEPCDATLGSPCAASNDLAPPNAGSAQ